MWVQTWIIAVGKKYLIDTVFNWLGKLAAIGM